MSRNRKKVVGQNLLLILGGVVFAVVLGGLILALFPQLISRSNTEREFANVTVDVQFKYTDGDLFEWMQGRLRPPEEDVIEAAFTISWDENSFRIPRMQADHYPIAAFGDSFTEGTTVAVPWTDLIAEEFNVPVRNYGYRNYGPHEIAQTAREFAGLEPRSWVLYTHFSGNDLDNANRSEDRVVDERSPFAILPWIEEPDASKRVPQIVLSEDGNYDYPMPVIIGGNYYEMAILDMYLWWQRAPEEGFAASSSFQAVGDALDALTEAVSEETCVAVIFVPAKGHLYYQYIHPAYRQWLRPVAFRPELQEDGKLWLADAPFSEAEEPDILAELSGQRDALRQMAEEKGIHFIDLLPAFQDKVAEGELIYYRYDTHWNQAGHDLAAQVIADYMRSVPDCPLTLD